MLSAQRINNIELGWRLDVNKDMLLDEEARLCDTKSVKRLLRCHFKDLLQIQENDPLVIYLEDNKEFCLKVMVGKP